MQNMKYFIPNDTFDNAISNKEIGVLKALLIGIIGADPTFATTEYEEANAYIKSKSEKVNGNILELFEPYCRQEDEYTKPQDDWNEEYYQMLLVWYRDNYAAERLADIKNVGREVYKNKATLGKSKRHNRMMQQKEFRQSESKNIKLQKNVSVVRSTGSDGKKTRLMIAEWLKKNWWWLAMVGVGTAFILWMMSRK